MREGKEKDGKGRLFQRMLFMPKVTHRTGGTRRTKKAECPLQDTQIL